MGNLRLGELDFGQDDAKAEVITRDEARRAIFKSSFLLPDGFDAASYLKGQLYFVSGRKGTGKTAFLRYLQMSLDEKQTAHRFIVFRDDVLEKDRAEIYRRGDVGVANQPDLSPSAKEVVDSWMVFIHTELARLLSEHKAMSTTPRELERYLNGTNEFRGVEQQDLLGRLIERVSQIETKWFRFRSTDKTQNISETLKNLAAMLAKVRFKSGCAIYLFFDELNLVVTSADRRERDMILIRDLISAVTRFNELSIEAKLPVHIVCAVRSEVVDSISTVGHEVHRKVKDWGREIQWFQLGAKRIGEQPLLRLIESRINACELHAGKPITQDIWASYFAETVNGSRTRNFVYYHSWSRPRDLVILLGGAAKLSPGRQLFNQSVFNAAAIAHSRRCWDERVQELAMAFAPQEISIIKASLIEAGREFGRATFEKALKDRASEDDRAKSLIARHSSAELLQTLYEIGVVGQKYSEKIFRWAHEGVREIDYRRSFRLHRALWAELAAGRVTDDLLKADDDSDD